MGNTCATARGAIEPGQNETAARRRRRGAMTMTMAAVQTKQRVPVVRSNRWIVNPRESQSSKALEDPAVQNAMKVCGI